MMIPLLKHLNNKMVIMVGNVTTDRKGFEFMSKIGNDIEKKKPEYITLDFSHCSFFEANMSSALYVIMARFIKKKTFTCVNMKDKIVKVLKKNQFSAMLNINTSHENDYNKTMLPFKLFDASKTSCLDFINYLECYLKGKGLPKMTNALIKKFHQNLLEVLINAMTHSLSPYGICSCGQYFPHKGRLDFTISDAGIGIKENVVKFTKEDMTATKAIKWALESGNTTREGNAPGGLGLNLLRQFISLNGGKLQIISKEGYYEFSKGIEAQKKTNDMEYSFPGTSINIEINTNDKKNYCLRTELS